MMKSLLPFKQPQLRAPSLLARLQDGTRRMLWQIRMPAKYNLHALWAGHALRSHFGSNRPGFGRRGRVAAKPQVNE